MTRKRVVVTGIGAVSPYGHDAASLWRGLLSGKGTIGETGDGGHLVARVPAFNEKRIPRQYRRCMSPMSMFACMAAEEALAMSGCAERDRLAVIFASTMGSPQALEETFRSFFAGKHEEEVRSTAFFRIMSHSVCSNVAQYLGVRGRQVAPSAACASGLVAIGLGYEAVATGRVPAALCGGADEHHELTVATFKKMGALSPERDPKLASLPFDRRRQGLVCSEGAGALLLEPMDAALARGACVLGEICGFSCLSSPESVAFPEEGVMVELMREAMGDAGMSPSDVGVVNAHATATTAGDAAEGRAIASVFRGQEESVRIHSLKGHMGHTMAASGALELVAGIQMLEHGLVVPTLGLEEPELEELDPMLPRRPEPPGRAVLIKNSFAMGGVYASLVLRKPEFQPGNTGNAWNTEKTGNTGKTMGAC